MKIAAATLSLAMLASGALRAQDHSHHAPAPEAAPSAEPERLDLTDRLLGSIRSAVEQRDPAAVRTSIDAYVGNLSGLREELARTVKPNEAGQADALDAAKRIAPQASVLEYLAREAPRRFRKDLERALASADAFLGAVARGREPDERVKPERRDPPSHRSSGSSCGH